MNKVAILIATFFLLALQVSGIDKADLRIKFNYKQWELIKTEPKVSFSEKWQQYELTTHTNPYRLTFTDAKGHVLWTKNNLRSAMDWKYFEHNSQNKGIIDYRKIPNGYKNIATSGSGSDMIDPLGNCLLLDKDYNRYVFVDKNGTETILPPNSGSLDFLGLYQNQYLMFYQLDYQDFMATKGVGPDLVRIPVYPNFNISTKYSNTKNWFVMFDKNGGVFKEYKLPDAGLPSRIFFDDTMKYMAYEFQNPIAYTDGYVVMSTTGEVYKVGAYRKLWEPAYSADGSLWIPNTGMGADIDVLNTRTGKTVLSLESVYPSGAAISNPETGYLLYADGDYISLLDYKNLNWLYSKYKKDAHFTNPWISGDGKEIRYTYQEKDKPAEIRTYRMK